MAIYAVWGDLLIWGLIAIYDFASGIYTESDLFFYLVVEGVHTIIPYMLQRRSDIARYVYTVLSIIAGIMFFSEFSVTGISLDDSYNFVSCTLSVWVMIVLFSKEGQQWFTKKPTNTTPDN